MYVALSDIHFYLSRVMEVNELQYKKIKEADDVDIKCKKDKASVLRDNAFLPPLADNNINYIT
jgi:hypothetical protein